jgi:hypothetical protein
VAIAGLGSLLLVAAASAQDLETLENPDLGVSLDLPVDWTSLAHPAGMLSSSQVRNEMGQPEGQVTVSVVDMAGKSFAEMAAEAEAGAQRRSTEDDVHLFERIEHSAGPAYMTTRRTTKGDKTQVVQAFHVEAAGKVFRVNCISPLSTEPDRLLGLFRAIADSLTAA